MTRLVWLALASAFALVVVRPAHAQTGVPGDRMDGCEAALRAFTDDALGEHCVVFRSPSNGTQLCHLPPQDGSPSRDWTCVVLTPEHPRSYRYSGPRTAPDTPTSTVGTEARITVGPTDTAVRPPERIPFSPALLATAALGVPPGEAQSGGADALGEALRVLGEIVVDRASQQGFELLRARLLDWLRCPASPTSPRADDGVEGGQPLLPETCAALTTLRIDDLVARPALLLHAAVADVISGAVVADDALPQLPARLRPIVRHLFGEAARAMVGDRRALDAADVRALVGELSAFGLAPENANDPTARRLRCGLALAAVGTARGDATNIPGECSENGALRPGVERLAGLVRAIGQEVHGTEPDLRRLTRAAVDLVREVVCAALSPSCGEDACDTAALLTAPRQSTPEASRDARVFLRAVRALHALLDGNTTAAALAVAEATLDRVAFGSSLDPNAQRRLARALRLFGGLVTYASTYAASDAQSTQGQSAGTTDAQRRQILETLSAEMTDRSERRGDWIVSVGGSLRLAAGARFAGVDGDAFWGPASLVLGFGLDLVPDDDVGLHVELGFFDLGQYLDFGAERRLATPSPAAALSPSLTVSMSFLGPQVPLFVGATLGVRPFAPEDEAFRGVLYLGGVAGAYVPLFDLN
ncbi:MAG: hypothetical protein OHK0013_23840 [Sandaracinaceae bacterium]